MPILESIQISEQKAEKFREEARKEVEALLEKVNDENQVLEKEMLESAKKKVQEINQKTKLDIENMKAKIESEQLEKNKTDFENAKTKMPSAIDFIINKVITS